MTTGGEGRACRADGDGDGFGGCHVKRDETNRACHFVLCICGEHLQQTQCAIPATRALSNTGIIDGIEGYIHVATLGNSRTNNFTEAKRALDGRVCEQARVLHVRPIHRFV